MFKQHYLIPFAVMICVYLLWTAEHLKGPKDKLKRIWHNRVEWERENTTLLRSSAEKTPETSARWENATTMLRESPEKATRLKSVEPSPSEVHGQSPDDMETDPDDVPVKTATIVVTVQKPILKRKMNTMVTVLSRRSAFETRKIIRETWGSGHDNVFFVVGTCCPIPPSDRKKWSCIRSKATSIEDQTKWDTDCAKEDLKIAEEEQTYMDIIRMPDIDVYRHLPQKVKFAYTWGLEHTTAKWFLKTDDDSVVRVDTLDSYLEKTYNSDGYVVVGRVEDGWGVHRSGKWAENDYRPSKYPKFPLGSVGHVVSKGVASYIADNSDELFNYQGEDVSIGIWLDESPLKSKVKWVTSKHMANHGNCKDTGMWVMGHNIKPAQMRECFAHKVRANEPDDNIKSLNHLKKGSLMSCAFVANNPSMDKSASEIDSHDFVIRFNNYWSKHFWPRPESVWGKKTDAVVFNNQKLTHSESLPKSVAYCVGRVAGGDTLIPKFYNLKQLKANPRTSKCDFLTRASKDGTWKRAVQLIRKYETSPKWKTGDISPTTGFLGVLWFEDICKKTETHFYGFDDWDGGWRNHRYNTEHKIIHDLFPTMETAKQTECPFKSPSLSSQHNGGWFYSKDLIAKEHVAFDEGFGKALMSYLGKTSLYDIGAGVGQFEYFLNKHKSPIDVKAFDGGNNIETLSGQHTPLRGNSMYVIPDNICWIDASVPTSLPSRPWVLSVEVGEHIAKHKEQTFIENLISWSSKGIIITWAKKGQHGHGHVNEQNNEYIIRQFEKRGLIYDKSQSTAFRRSVSKLPWLRNTIMVFKYPEIAQKPSCAIVFNAGVLLKHEDGPVIDSYDWQIRFNMIPIKGFEKHVGSKTTHEAVHFWSPKGKTPGELFADLDSDSLTGITFPIEQKEINGYNKWKTKTKSHWIMPSQDYLSSCKRKVGIKSGFCSSGMTATLWAVDECSNVTIFGANHDPCYPYYYTEQMPAKCRVQTVGGYMKQGKHDFDAEHKLLQEMHRDGKLNLYRFEETFKTNRTPLQTLEKKDVTRNKIGLNLGVYPIKNEYINIFESKYPIFVNFYTGDNGYDEQVAKLISSLRKWKLPYYIIDIDSLGHRWEYICQLKPVFILKVMDLYPDKNIVWIDADAIILKPPELFTHIDQPISVHYFDNHELGTGTVYLKNNKKAKTILGEWIDEQKKDKTIWDQKALQKVMRNHQTDVYPLPKEYIAIFDKKGYAELDMVIVQNQASRKYKFNKRYNPDASKTVIDSPDTLNTAIESLKTTLETKYNKFFIHCDKLPTLTYKHPPTHFLPKVESLGRVPVITGIQSDCDLLGAGGCTEIEGRETGPDIWLVEFISISMKDCHSRECLAIDIGSNLGLLTLRMRQQGVKVYSIEPQIDLCCAAKSTLKWNNLIGDSEQYCGAVSAVSVSEQTGFRETAQGWRYGKNQDMTGFYRSLNIPLIVPLINARDLIIQGKHYDMIKIDTDSIDCELLTVFLTLQKEGYFSFESAALETWTGACNDNILFSQLLFALQEDGYSLYRTPALGSTPIKFTHMDLTEEVQTLVTTNLLKFKKMTLKQWTDAKKDWRRKYQLLVTKKTNLCVTDGFEASGTCSSKCCKMRQLKNNGNTKYDKMCEWSDCRNCPGCANARNARS